MIFLKSFVAKILTNPIIGFLISKFYSDLLPFKGLKIYTDSDLIMNKTKAQIFWHIYEGAEIKFIHKYFPSGFDTIEFGSSIGVVSSFIRSKMSKENKLICVEAFPDLCDLTTKNLQLNGAYDNSKVYNSAVNYSDKNVNIFFSPGSSNTTGSISTNKINKNSINISKTTLSKIKDNNCIREFILVMDIEGAEIEIILNEEKSLKDCKHLFVELHETTLDKNLYRVDDMIDILINIHKFKLIDKNDNVCYLNK